MVRQLFLAGRECGYYYELKSRAMVGVKQGRPGRIQGMAQGRERKKARGDIGDGKSYYSFHG